MKYEINKGDFKLKKIPFELYNISIRGTIDNGKDRSFNSTKITADLFKAETKNGTINGVFSLTNLNSYFLNANLQSLGI